MHGDGDHAFIPRLIAVAREKRVSVYVGDGLNRWPAVHRLDAAHLFRMVLELRETAARYHGVADEGIAFPDIAAIIGRRLGVPVASKTPQEAIDELGFLGRVIATDCPASGAWTQAAMRWRPTRPGLVADLEYGRYFESD